MKLENLKADKFEPFKDNEIKAAIAIIGGEPQNTTYSNIRYTGTDVIDIKTHPRFDIDKGTSTVEGMPGSVDYYYTSRNPR